VQGDGGGLRHGGLLVVGRGRPDATRGGCAWLHAVTTSQSRRHMSRISYRLYHVSLSF